MQSFEDVWKRIVSQMDTGSVIHTLSQSRPNTIRAITEEGVLVTTGGQPEMVKKEWIQSAWQVLVENGSLQADDIPDSARYRSSFIMALLAQLSDIKVSKNPTVLNLQTSKAISPLTLGEIYTREQVHDIFDPYSPFKSGTGTWGIQGIVGVPNRPSDYVFFVTFGQKQGEHEFKEEITEDGILTWHSQPKQTLDDPDILNFISHNHLIDNIYLFLRTRRINPTTKKAEPFTYLGKLAYVTHDTKREQPVWFKWQLLDWDRSRYSIEQGAVTKNDSDEGSEEKTLSTGLVQTEPPKPKTKENNGVPTNVFTGHHFDYSGVETKQTGLIGELIVMEYEKDYLRTVGRPDLADKVIHTSVVEGDGTGYDILSYHADGSVKYIEVKTTTGGIGTPFIMTINEVKFSQTYASSYYLYRVYGLKKSSKSAQFYVLPGAIDSKCTLAPIQFRVSQTNFDH